MLLDNNLFTQVWGIIQLIQNRVNLFRIEINNKQLVYTNNTYINIPISKQQKSFQIPGHNFFVFLHMSKFVKFNETNYEKQKKNLSKHYFDIKKKFQLINSVSGYITQDFKQQKKIHNNYES